MARQKSTSSKRTAPKRTQKAPKAPQRGGQKRRTRGASDTKAPAAKAAPKRARRTQAPEPVGIRGKGAALLQRYAQRLTETYESVTALIVARSQRLLGQLKHASLPIAIPSPRKYRIGAG